MDDHGYRLSLFLIMGMAGFGAAMVIGLVPFFVRIALKVKGLISMMDHRPGMVVLVTASLSVVLVYGRLIFALATADNVPVAGQLFYGVAFGLMDVAMVVLGLAVVNLYRRHPELAP